MSESGARRRRPLWADPRILLSLAITGIALWFALRGVDFSEVAGAMARADLPLMLGLSIPAYLATLWGRALRWRHLTEAVSPMSNGVMFRAVAVGFMANNIFPFRMGELIRAWFLSRETGTSGAAILGTVIVERILDAVVVITLMAIFVGAGGARAAGLDPAAVMAPLLVIALVPLTFVVLLLVSPERVVTLVRALGRVLPAGLVDRLAAMTEQMAEGLASLRSGRRLFWVAFHSVVVWGIYSVIPFWAALAAIDLDLGSSQTYWMAAYTLLTWIALAVSLPSAPGFFGPYHAACWVALAPFGVEKEPAIALGTLAHAVFWVTMTAAGLFSLRGRGARLRDLDEVAARSG